MFESHVFLLVLESSVMDHFLYDFRAPESFFILFSLKSDVDDFFQDIQAFKTMGLRESTCHDCSMEFHVI